MLRITPKLLLCICLFVVLASGCAPIAEAQAPPILPPQDGAQDADAPLPLPDIDAIDNPAVRAAYTLPRNEPADYVRAILNLLDFREPALAQSVFRDLQGLNLNDEQRAALVARFGTAAILRIGQTKDLGPAATTFAQTTIAAASAAATAPERINQLVANLGNPGAPQREAIAALSTLGEPGIMACLAVLADPASDDEQKRGARTVLVRSVPLSVGPLLAAIDAPEPLRSEAATLLATIRPPQAAPLLAAPAATEGHALLARAYESLTGQPASVESAEGLLRRSLENVLGGVPPAGIGPEGQIEVWVWDAEKNLPTRLTLSPDDAATLHAARLAHGLTTVRPERSGFRIEAAAWGIEAGAILRNAGLDAGATAPKLEIFERAEVDQLLLGAIERNHSATAIAALGVHAERKDPGALFTHDGKPSATAQALRAGHPRVRYAALQVIAAIDPPRPFPGASHVATAMIHTLTATGSPKVLAAAPRADVASTWAAGLSSAGYQGEIATLGKEAIEVARLQADIELVLVDMAIGGPGVREVVFQLRRNPGTELVPIAVLGRESQWPIGRQIEEEHWGVRSFPRPHGDAALLAIGDEMRGLLPRDWPSAEERLAMRRQVLQWMDHFLSSRRDFYRLRAYSTEIALAVPAGDATLQAWQLLADMGTHESQNTLIRSASMDVYPIETRQAAAAAFARSVERFGLLLTSDEILLAYDTYNASGQQPKESQEVLGSLLDAIESVRKARQQTPPPPPTPPTN